MTPRDAVLAIRLGMMTDCSHMLPTALYTCCMAEEGDIEGCDWVDELLKEYFGRYRTKISKARCTLAAIASTLHVEALSDAAGARCTRKAICAQELHR